MPKLALKIRVDNRGSVREGGARASERTSPAQNLKGEGLGEAMQEYSRRRDPSGVSRLTAFLPRGSVGKPVEHMLTDDAQHIPEGG